MSWRTRYQDPHRRPRGEDHPDRTGRARTPAEPATPARSESRVTDDRAAEHTEVRADPHTARDSFIGTDQGSRSVNNSSWGAIFAGTVTFLALMLVFGLISAALGLTEVGGIAVGIWSIIALLLALAAAGYVAGALAVHGGLLHGLVTWATSLVGIVVLVGWMGAGVLGAAGGALGTAAEGTDATVSQLEQQLDVDEEEVEQAQQDAEEAAGEAQDTAAEAAWWTVAGLLIGAAVAALAGVAGARSVHTRDAELHTTRGRH